MCENKDTIILGLDEAGRGPVLGPMVIALVKATEKDLKKFEELGFRDSKKLNKSKRNGLYNIIMENYEVKTIILEASEIDRMIEKTNLNNIEIGIFSKLINKVLKEEYDIKKSSVEDAYCNKKIKIYIDACSNDERAFKNKIKSKLILHNKNIEIIAEHGADDKYKIVSAASIIAKVVRDRIIDNYKHIYGEIGSGYPSDRITTDYLKKYAKEHGELPDIARKCWKTSKNIMKNVNKKKEESVNNNGYCIKKNNDNSNKDGKKYIQKKLF